MRVAYLHGFASSARSSKAAFFASRFARHGIELHTPDFNEPDFSTLTISRMVTQVCDWIDADHFDFHPGVAKTMPEGSEGMTRRGGGAPRQSKERILFGSSLGGFVAVQSALQRPRLVDRLVLLAPALDFGGNRMRTLGDRGLEEWQRTNRLEVFHYGYGRVMPVEYALYADAQRYDVLNATLTARTIVFQGTRDEAVDPKMVERWSNARPGIVELHMLDDDHQLLGSLEEIWRATAGFLGLTRDRGPGTED